jgi:hypothetical protein
MTFSGLFGVAVRGLQLTDAGSECEKRWHALAKRAHSGTHAPQSWVQWLRNAMVSATEHAG